MQYAIKLASSNCITICKTSKQLQHAVERLVLRDARAIRTTTDALAMCAAQNVMVLFGAKEIDRWLRDNGLGQYNIYC